MEINPEDFCRPSEDKLFADTSFEIQIFLPPSPLSKFHQNITYSNMEHPPPDLNIFAAAHHYIDPTALLINNDLSLIPVASHTNISNH